MKSQARFFKLYLQSQFWHQIVSSKVRGVISFKFVLNHPRAKRALRLFSKKRNLSKGQSVKLRRFPK